MLIIKLADQNSPVRKKQTNQVLSSEIRVQAELSEAKSKTGRGGAGAGAGEQGERRRRQEEEREEREREMVGFRLGEGGFQKTSCGRFFVKTTRVLDFLFFILK